MGHVHVAAAAAGDANLDGTVDFADFQVLKWTSGKASGGRTATRMGWARGWGGFKDHRCADEESDGGAGGGSGGVAGAEVICWNPGRPLVA